MSGTMNRRRMILTLTAAVMAGGIGGLSNALGADAASIVLPFDNGARALVKCPQKRPMIGLTQRPPQLETPFSVFDEGVITPNDAFLYAII